MYYISLTYTRQHLSLAEKDENIREDADILRKLLLSAIQPNKFGARIINKTGYVARKISRTLEYCRDCM
jgi:hypothetical protein